MQRCLFFLYLTLVICFPSCGVERVLDLTEKVLIAQRLQELCPGTNICRNNITEEKEDPCCTACSCEEDCGVSLPCCFQNDEEKRIEGIYQPEDCLYAQYPQPSYPDRQFIKYFNFPSYYMLGDPKTVPNDNLIDSNDSCESDNLVPWGSLYPVTSITTGITYRNSLCAKKRNVTDFVYWTAKVRCALYNFETAGYVVGKSIEWPDHCYVFFRLKSPVDIRPSVCLLNKVNYCIASDPLPHVLNLTDDMVRTGCSSGLLSPFRTSVFSNAFCNLCSNETVYMNIGSDCDKETRYPFSDFTYLLEPTAFEALGSDVSTDDNVEEACWPSNDTSEVDQDCRKIHCPSGQYRRLTDGECLDSAKYWISETGFAVYLQLTPRTALSLKKIKLDEILDMLNGPVSKTFTIDVIAQHLKNGTPNITESTIFSNFLELNSNNTELMDKTNNLNNSESMVENQVDFFLVRMSTGLKMIKPRIFRNFVSKIWTLVTDDGTETLDTSLADYFGYTNDVQFLLCANAGKRVKLQSLRVIYQRYNLLDLRHPANKRRTLHKTLFCNTIELMFNEFEMLPRNALLQMKKNNILLPYSVFMLKDLYTGVRICVENSGYQKIDTARGSTSTLEHGKTVGSFVLAMLAHSLLEL